MRMFIRAVPIVAMLHHSLPIGGPWWVGCAQIASVQALRAWLYYSCREGHQAAAAGTVGQYGVVTCWLC